MVGIDGTGVFNELSIGWSVGAPILSRSARFCDTCRMDLGTKKRRTDSTLKNPGNE